MAENRESFQQNDIKLPFRIKNQDGSYITGIDPKTGERVPIVRRLSPDEVNLEKSYGKEVELVEPKPFNSRIELSQTTHDKD